MTSSTYTLGRESADDGSFRRQESQFRRWVSDEPGGEFPVAGGRYHLYVARACPWAHRTIIARRLMGLEEAIGVSFVDPVRDERGWAFTGGEYVDPVNGFSFLSEAYVATDPAYEARVTRPGAVGRANPAWSSPTSRPTSCGCSAPCSRRSPRIRSICIPSPLRDEIDALNDRIYDNVNNAVYKAGFSRAPGGLRGRGARAVRDARRARRAAGRRAVPVRPEPVETDWRLFTTLVRFDAVYQIHFKCSLRKLIEYEHLWPYARDLYQWPGVAETVSFDEIRRHYYLTHPMINPSGLVAVRPRSTSTSRPGRESLG